MEDDVAAARGGCDELEIAHVAPAQLGAGALDVGRIADREVVDDEHVVAGRGQRGHQGRADEAGPARHERARH